MDLKLYLAPLEGVTTFIFRKIFLNRFSGIDKVFLPFISTNVNLKFKKRELRELQEEKKSSVKIIPQFLSNNFNDFIEMSKVITDLGYDEINWNIGCPSPTVVTKNKGSGFLPYKDKIDKFLENIFSKLKCRISIKTRLGKDCKDDFIKLINIFNKYPLEELIIHPRTGVQLYNGLPDTDFFEQVYKTVRAEVCYNGNIFDLDGYMALTKRFPAINKFMIGRAAVFRPVIFEEIKNKRHIAEEEFIKRFLDFHDELVFSYKAELSGESHLMFKIKEYWKLFSLYFKDEDLLKKINRAKNMVSYSDVIRTYLR